MNVTGMVFNKKKIVWKIILIIIYEEDSTAVLLLAGSLPKEDLQLSRRFVSHKTLSKGMCVSRVISIILAEISAHHSVVIEIYGRPFFRAIPT